MTTAAEQSAAIPRSYLHAVKWTVPIFAIGMLRKLLPLSFRKALVLRLAKSRLHGLYRLTFLLLEDFSRDDPSGFQKFLWSHHLGHAESYELNRRFGKSNLEPTRRLMLERVAAELRKQAIDPETDVQSALDVGCSLGHVLRFVETEFFPAASVLEGIDLDSYAIEKGSEYLRDTGSKASLACADLSSLSKTIAGKNYDVILCFGVLMYVDEQTAAQAIKSMLQHTKMLLAVSTWPHPEIDNRSLPQSVPAPGLVKNRADLMDGVLIHNLDRMATAAGGKIVSRCWTGAEVVQGDKPLYYLLVRP
ncbi:MAG: class I SAM-dependent methyltransferase [Acidobacteria bacterium]|nr:class I SAM-dependent methyltransferase [Acidobacteriota bacterium]MBV9438326.1 class I SAM-dependent methyltransferase [Acidobacteriota bacterium]